MNPELRAYKEKTVNQLQTNLSLLQTQLAEENRPDVITSIDRQIDEIQDHIEHLKQELAAGLVGKPVADELCRKVAYALTKEKMHMARRYLTKLETIEPFYPGLDRLHQELESGRISRRTRAIGEGRSEPYGAAAFPTLATADSGEAVSGEVLFSPAVEREKRGGLSQFFSFHIVLSCAAILLIACVMMGIGGISLLEWLIEGG